MNLLLKNVAQHISLTSEEENHLLSLTELRRYPAKSILLNSGDICTHSYFVNSGVLRSFTINDNIVEHVLNFACSGWWIADFYSLISQKPGSLFIDAIEDTEVVLLSKENQNQLYRDIPKFERFFRILVENSLVANQQRIMDNLSMTAEERYAQFLKRYPNLANQIPQKHLASYIGVTPEFFSKMKASYLKRL
ncbi:MAG: Crp/Fnr family transcriptional regulator [Flavobacterium sp.]|nr:Crp/Fnr family transcriptional regulator [Flavobacterium sp.]